MEREWLGQHWPPETARLAVRGERIAQMIARREQELESLRDERDHIILELDRVPGMTAREIAGIVDLSHVRVRKVINQSWQVDAE